MADSAIQPEIIGNLAVNGLINLLSYTAANLDVANNF